MQASMLVQDLPHCRLIRFTECAGLTGSPLRGLLFVMQANKVPSPAQDKTRQGDLHNSQLKKFPCALLFQAVLLSHLGNHHSW